MPETTIKDRLKEILPQLRDAQWYADRATRFLKAGDLKNAARTIQKAERKFGGDASLRLASAKINSTLGSQDAVRTDLQRILEDKEASFKSRLSACELYQSIDDTDAALQLLNDLGQQYSRNQRGVVAYNTAIHIYKRIGDLFNALNAGINATAAGGTAPWGTMIELAQEADQVTIERCRARMRELVKEDIHNGYFFKMMSLLDWRAGDREAMLQHMGDGTKLRFERLNRDVPWVDEADPLKPSFLIIGSMKCGSTSLFDQINRHPLCLAAMDKELQFFQHSELDDQWYLEHFPRVSPFPGFFTGEGSPGYFGFDIVDRVKAMLPDVKLLFIKRDPIDRAISHFRHNTRWGLTAGLGVEAVIKEVDETQAALTANPDRVEEILMGESTEFPTVNAYLRLGCYEILLRRWYAAFPSEQILELQLEDYHASPQETMDQVFAFLDVESVEVEHKQSNKGDYVKTDAKTQRVMERLREFYDAVDALAL